MRFIIRSDKLRNDILYRYQRKAAKKNISWTNEFFDILWKRGLIDDLREAFEVSSAFSSLGDGPATGRLARAYRDGKGVDKDIEKAIEFMRIAGEKGVGWAKNELVDMLMTDDINHNEALTSVCVCG